MIGKPQQKCWGFFFWGITYLESTEGTAPSGFSAAQSYYTYKPRRGKFGMDSGITNTQSFFWFPKFFDRKKYLCLTFL